jgi:hypothetical protein
LEPKLSSASTAVGIASSPLRVLGPHERSAKASTGCSVARLVAELWQWPYEPELDRWGIARVPIPERMQHGVHVGYRVHLMCPDGAVLKGRVVESNSHYARVQVDKDE